MIFGRDETAPEYWIWAVDNSAYGPVELPALVAWIKDERVVAETWIYSAQGASWAAAAEVPEIKMFFKRKPSNGEAGECLSANDLKIKPADLRRIKIMTEMSDDDLATFLEFMEVIQIGPSVHLYHKGDPGDAMYAVLDGEMRSSLIVDGKEAPIAILPPGSIFGEVALLDHGPHAVDIISNKESLLLKISTIAFDKLVRQRPQVALPFVLALSKAIAGRTRVVTKRFEDSVHVAHSAGLNSARAEAPGEPVAA